MPSSMLPTRSWRSVTPLATARKARHLNQTDLADLTGMSQGDISKIERGVVAPTTITLLKLVQALGAELTLTLPADVVAAPITEDASARVQNRAEPLALVMA